MAYWMALILDRGGAQACEGAEHCALDLGNLGSPCLLPKESYTFLHR